MAGLDAVSFPGCNDLACFNAEFLMIMAVFQKPEQKYCSDCKTVLDHKSKREWYRRSATPKSVTVSLII